MAPRGAVGDHYTNDQHYTNGGAVDRQKVYSELLPDPRQKNYGRAKSIVKFFIWYLVAMKPRYQIVKNSFVDFNVFFTLALASQTT